MSDDRRAGSGGEPAPPRDPSRRTVRAAVRFMVSQLRSAVLWLVIPTLQASAQAVLAGAAALIVGASIWLVGPLVGVILALAIFATWLVSSRVDRSRAGDQEAPAEQPHREHEAGIETLQRFVSVHEGLADAVANADVNVGDFIRSSVLAPFVDVLKGHLANGPPATVSVELAIVEVTGDHRLKVAHGVGRYVRGLQDEPPCYRGRVELAAVLAEKAQAHFVRGGYACVPCQLVPGQEHYLIALTSVPFPAHKRSVLVYLARDIEASAAILTRLVRAADGSGS